LFATFLANRLRQQDPLMANSGSWKSPWESAWNSPRFQISELKLGELNTSRVATGVWPGNLTGSRSSSILFSRIGNPGSREHGLVAIRLSYEGYGHRHPAQAISLAYGPKDNAAKIVRRLCDRINADHKSAVRATAMRSGSGTALELESRAGGEPGFLVSVSVDSGRDAASIRASVLPVTETPPHLLTAARSRVAVAQ